MSRSWTRIALAVLLMVFAFPGLAQGPEPRSSRNANYAIDARLDPEAKLLVGTQVLTWRNIQKQPTRELWFHLYWNAWRNNRSTWMLEDRIRERSDLRDEIREEDWSYIEIESVRLLPAENHEGSDLEPGLRYAWPDDGNEHDRTVIVVDLPRPVAPGETIQVQMNWIAKIPRTFARTGYRGNFFFLAHWFPKLGVYEADGWNCHQYHAGTEYYSDYGVYDVKMTVPGDWVLGATGRQVERIDNEDGTATHRYFQEDVHAFSWTTSPDYLIYTERFTAEGLPAVEMRLMIQPEHLGQVDRHFAAARAALEHYGRWYGPYPYGHVTFVDPAYGSGAGGMEYPTLFTCGTRLFNPFGGGSPEGVTVHEAGHQFWYGIVGNNEFEHAWIDEGFNTFSTGRTMQTVYGDRFYVRRYLKPSGGRSGLLPVAFREVTVPSLLSRLDRYRGSALSDDPDSSTYLYYPSTGGNISYSKTALWLTTLERHLGWDVLQPIMSTFFERYKFEHPTPEQFLEVADEVSGQDLSWFFDQIYRDSVTFDYAVASVTTKPAEAEGWTRDGGEMVYSKPEPDDDDSADAGIVYRSEVVVQRLGGGRFPVDVLMVFEDGHQIRQRWDGEAHWRSFVVERDSKLDHAVIDPERVLMLDLRYTNNSMYAEEPSRLAARKWGSKWMIWLQDLMSTFAYYM